MRAARMYESLCFYRQIATPTYVATPTAVGFDAATTAWVAAVVSNGGTVSGARQIVVNSLIVSLKADGIWTKLDRLWLHAAENEPSALTDIVANVLATEFNTPAFAVDLGYTGEDSGTPGHFIKTGFIPSTSGVTYIQNSAHISAWVVGNIASANGGCLLGASNGGAFTDLYATYAADNNVYGRINDSGASGGQGTSVTRAGQWLANRDSSTTSQVYQNGSLFSSPNQVSGTPTTVELYITCENANGSSVGGTPNQIAMVSMGGGFNGTDVTNFYNALRTYMTAVGVP